MQERICFDEGVDNAASAPHHCGMKNISSYKFHALGPVAAAVVAALTLAGCSGASLTAVSSSTSASSSSPAAVDIEPVAIDIGPDALRIIGTDGSVLDSTSDRHAVDRPSSMTDADGIVSVLSDVFGTEPDEAPFGRDVFSATPGTQYSWGGDFDVRVGDKAAPTDPDDISYVARARAVEGIHIRAGDLSVGDQLDQAFPCPGTSFDPVKVEGGQMGQDGETLYSFCVQSDPTILYEPGTVQARSTIALLGEDVRVRELRGPISQPWDVVEAG